MTLKEVINENKSNHDIKDMCTILGVARRPYNFSRVFFYIGKNNYNYSLKGTLCQGQQKKREKNYNKICFRIHYMLRWFA